MIFDMLLEKNKKNIETPTEPVKEPDEQEEQPTPSPDKPEIILPQLIINEPICTVILDRENNKVQAYIRDIIVSDPKPYNKFMALLKTLSENYIVKIDITTCVGGSVPTGLMIIESMLKSKATIITDVKGYAYSMGAYIWAFGTYRNLQPGSLLMFHNILQSLPLENINLLDEIIQTSKEFAENFIKKLQERNILTEEQIKLILEENKDLFLTYEDLQQALNPYKEE